MTIVIERDLEDMLEAMHKAAYLKEPETSCDICDRFPHSDRDGIEVCTRCRLAEVLEAGDLGAVSINLMDEGINKT